MKCYVDMPYPKIDVEKKDVDLAKRLFSVYAGCISEDTSIHLYTLQMLLFSGNNELKEILKNIAIVEMHHLEILGTLIKKLGFVPLFLDIENDKIKWFSGEYISYQKNLEGVLINNIRLEKEAIHNYEQIIKETSDTKVIHIIKRIILDERLHVEIFENILEKLNLGKLSN